jgi:hypothetical protein
MSRISLLFAPLLLVSACGQKPVEIAVPPPERFAPVAEPKVPAGEADCDGEPCISDRQAASYIIALIDALRTANNKLAWLGDWRAGVTE